ncbi:MAG: hypothetical protein ACTSPO_14855 [Candidatus Heimdallarchaeaceae archaeon]
MFGQSWLSRKNKNLSFLSSRSSRAIPSIELKIKIKDTHCILKRELTTGNLINLAFENFEVVKDKTKMDMYSHWLESTTNMPIEKLADIYDILFYFEEGTHINRTLWDIERQAKLLRYLIGNIEHVEKLEQLEIQLTKLSSNKARLRNTKSLLTKRTTDLKKILNLKKISIPDISSLVKDKSVEQKIRSIAKDIEVLNSEKYSIQDQKLRYQSELKEFSNELEILKESYFKQETKLAKEVLPPRNFHSILLDQLKHGFCLVCEQKIALEKSNSLLNQSKCILCDSQLAETESEESISIKESLMKEISKYTDFIKNVRFLLKKTNSQLKSKSMEIENKLLILSKLKITPVDELDEKDDINLLSLSVLLDQLDSIEIETRTLNLYEHEALNEIQTLQL